MKNLLNEEIETPRLLLVPILMEYKDIIFNEFTKDITTFMHPRPAKSIKETEDFINKSLKRLKRGNNLQMVILEKKSKEFLGCAGLHHADQNTPELGIWLKKSAHGNSYGKEAIMALKEWADNNLDYDYLLYPVADKNIPSRKIPESLGGKLARKYNKKNLSGQKHHILEYRIYP